MGRGLDQPELSISLSAEGCAAQDAHEFLCALRSVGHRSEGLIHRRGSRQQVTLQRKILTADEAFELLGAFEAFAPFVPEGGYVVIENTVVNGRPVESGFGPGPYEALVDILGRHPEFVSDPTFERYTVTFNRGGYLRRMPT